MSALSLVMFCVFLVMAGAVLLVLSLLFIFIPMIWWGFCHLLDELVDWEEELS